MVHSGHNIVVGEIRDGGAMLARILHCLPELLVIVRIEILKKELTISKHCRHPVSHSLVLFNMVMSPRALSYLE